MSQASSTPKDWGKLTVAELKEELTSRGLSIAGRKPELVQRLKDSKDSEVFIDESVEEMEGTEVENGQNETGEETHYLTAVEEEAEVGKEVQEEVKVKNVEETAESGKQKENVPTGIKGDDAMSKADSLTVNLDQDIASLGDLEESKDTEVEGDAEETVVEAKETSKSFTLDRTGDFTLDKTGDMSKTEDGVLIDAVGEVDDDEFGAAVANLEESRNEEEMKTDEEKSKTEEEKKEEPVEKKKEYAPLPHSQFDSWVLKLFYTARKYSSLYIKPLTAKDVLCAAIVEWANRAVYFCINHEKDGKGVAILNFITEKECKEAKASLIESLGSEVSVVHLSRSIENEIRKEKTLSYKLESSDVASRTLVLEDAPEGTTEDQVCLLFPGAISVSRPEINDPIYNWQNRQYALYMEITKCFLVEFGYPKASTRALAEEYEIQGQKIKLMSMLDYKKQYKAYVQKKEEEERAKRRAEAEQKRKEREKKAMEEVFSDKERIEMCKAMKEVLSKRGRLMSRSDLPWNDKLMQKEKLSDKLMDIVRALDMDTDKRQLCGLGLPEPENLMTKNTRRAVLKNPKLLKGKSKKNPKDKKSNQKKEDKDSLKITVNSESEKREVVEQKDAESKGEEKTGDANESDVIVIEDEDAKKTVDGEEKKDGEKGEESKDSNVIEVPADGEEETGDAEEILSKVVEDILARSEHSDKSDKKDAKKSKASDKDHKKNRKGAAKREDKKGSKITERRRTLTARENEDLRTELGRLEEDKRGWWSVSVDRLDPKLQRTDYEKEFKKYGNIMEIHQTTKKVFVRFSARRGAAQVLRQLYGTKYNPTAPPVIGAWKKTPSDRDTSRERVRDTLSREREVRGRDEFGRTRKDIPSLLSTSTTPASVFQQASNPIALQIQKQAQQQLMLQQQLHQQQQLQQQQQQQVMLMQQLQQQQAMQQQHMGSSGSGILGAGPRSMDMGGDSMSMRQNASRQQSGSSGIPSLFGSDSVPPVRGGRRERSRSPVSRGLDRSRNVQKKSPDRMVQYDRDRSSYNEPKRARMDDYGYDDYGESRNQRNRSPDLRETLSRDTSSAPQADAVANMLKGLTQVISTKMKEITRISGVGDGEPAVRDVMHSISSMQKSLMPGQGNMGSSNTGTSSLLPTPASRAAQQAKSTGYGGTSQAGGSYQSSYRGQQLQQQQKSATYGGAAGGSSHPPSLLGDPRLKTTGYGGSMSQQQTSAQSQRMAGGYANSQQMYSNFSQSSGNARSGMIDYSHQSSQGRNY